MSVYEESLKLHEKYHGKLKVEAKVPCEDAKDLSLAYTPGVAEPCRKIHEDKEMSYVYTNRANTVAVISDGTAVLGLGDIGAEAALPGRLSLIRKIQKKLFVSVRWLHHLSVQSI